MGRFPFESMQPWLMDSDVGPSARAQESLWRCRTESHILLLFKKSRLIPYLAYSNASGRGAACLRLERNIHPCLPSIPAFTDAPCSAIRTGTKETSYQRPLFPLLLLKYSCSVFLILQPWYQMIL